MLRLDARIDALEGTVSKDRLDDLRSRFNEPQSPDEQRIRLLFASQPIFSEYDRLSAEGDFRANIAPPIIVLSWILASETAPLWGLVGTILALLLAWQGFQKSHLANDILVRAVAANVIKLPLVDEIDRVSVEVTASRGSKPGSATGPMAGGPFLSQTDA